MVRALQATSLRGWIPALIGVGLTMIATISNGAAQMPKIYVPTPEAELFLRLAATKLAEHKASKGSFPTKWSDLDITYVNGPYYTGIMPPTSSLRPRPGLGDRGGEKSDSEFRLTTNAARDGFGIDAVGPSGRAEYFIDQGQDYPTKVDPAVPLATLPAR